MPSFRASKKQAEHLIKQNLAIGKPRHNHQQDDKIHSDGTANRYQQALVNLSEWLKANNILSGLNHLTLEHAKMYLDERSEQIVQKTLNIERRAIQTATGLEIKPVRSLLPNNQKFRGYSLPQIDLIIQRVTPRNAISIQIANKSGTRAHEFFSLRPPGFQEPSSHREWSTERFTGRSNIYIYTVTGKGGLIREVAIPEYLHLQLEQLRLEDPGIIIDRGIKYEPFYDIGGGHALSNSFSRLSKKELGWSDGLHALRHNYARSRMDELQERGYNYYHARKIVSQEMGHFRGDVTEVYLR